MQPLSCSFDLILGLPYMATAVYTRHDCTVNILSFFSSLSPFPHLREQAALTLLIHGRRIANMKANRFHVRQP